jgi:hypothetical protein
MVENSCPESFLHPRILFYLSVPSPGTKKKKFLSIVGLLMKRGSRKESQ